MGRDIYGVGGREWSDDPFGMERRINKTQRIREHLTGMNSCTSGVSGNRAIDRPPTPTLYSYEDVTGINTNLTMKDRERK